MKYLPILLLPILITLSSCAPVDEPVIELPAPAVAVLQFTVTPSPTLTPEPTLTPTINPLRTIAPTLTPSPTPDPYVDMYIDSLANRKYGGGVLEDLGLLNSTSGAFTRRLFRFRSDGLQMYGFINIPTGEGPYPVIIMLHGHVEPEEYKTLDYSTRYADALAEQGYVVLHPNLRGYAPSPAAENRLGIGDTIDTLNLLALVRQFSGVEGILKKADAEQIGLWGHSMGGGIVLRILVVDPDIDAALLYASINADETLNLEHFEKDGRGIEKISAPEETINLLSPLNYLDRINAPLSIHHGEADAVVPVEWSIDLCEKLQSLDQTVECWNYVGQPHTFQNSGDTQLIARTTEFFNAHLKK
jgi:dipeptidyl aminopeptidase/acylaminoacyl peptidase